MTEREYTIIRSLENKIQIAEYNNHRVVIITIDLLKEILFHLKEKDKLSSMYGIQEVANNGKDL